MSVILSLLGIVLAAAGVAAIGFGIPINEFTLGTTLVLAGTTGLAGGLVLIGLASVVAELGRITDALKTRPVARPAARPPQAVEPVVRAAPSIVAVPTPGIAASVRPSQANIPSQANVPQANVPPRLRHEAPVRDARPIEADTLASQPSTVDASSNAIERLRSSIPRAERPKPEPSLVADHDDVPLSPNGGHHQAQQPMPPSGQSQSPESKVPTDDRAGDAAVDALKASRLDFLFRAKPARSTTSPENFDAFWPSERRVGSVEAEAGPKVEDVQSQPDQAVSVQDPLAESTPPQEPPATAILKSGVVEGMAYTLYADGSIEAELPNGTVRFSSIAELRAHIESNS
jgi:hypothetical protein